MVESKKLDKFKPGLLRQELVSYEILKGNLYKKTETRNYQKDGDYIDSYKSEYIGGGNENTDN
jgi:hypothetical protein|tara:strand:+ start:1413 stop:1601 length:189 start_codon:yes stop_codon:yes gene_type:complete